MRKLLPILLVLSASVLGASASAVEIQNMTELAAAPASGDFYVVVDVSDTTGNPAGTGKRQTAANLFQFAGPYAGTITAADVAGDTTTFPMLATGATGTTIAGTDAGLSYDASTNTLTTTTFVGSLTGTASGNAPIDSPTFATEVLLPDGNGSTTMAWGFASDDDGTGTGCYRSAANTATCRSNGSTKLIWDNSGVTWVGRLYGNTNGTIEGWLEVGADEAVTTTKTPGAGEEGECYTNTGDTDGSTITLENNPTQGICHCFMVTVAQTMTIVPNTGETLYEDGDQCVVSLSSATIGVVTKICAATGGSGAVWMTQAPTAFVCND